MKEKRESALQIISQSLALFSRTHQCGLCVGNKQRAYPTGGEVNGPLSRTTNLGFASGLTLFELCANSAVQDLEGYFSTVNQGIR